ncbi:putative leader peptide [Streptomyces sp. UNOC14_S4]
MIGSDCYGVVYDGDVTMLVKRRHVDLRRVTSMSCRRSG